MNASTASRIICVASLDAWLSSTSSATVSGSVAGPAFSTSRGLPSSRTRKSSAVSPVAGSPLPSTTLTYTPAWRGCAAATGGSAHATAMASAERACFMEAFRIEYSRFILGDVAATRRFYLVILTVLVVAFAATGVYLRQRAVKAASGQGLRPGSGQA